MATRKARVVRVVKPRHPTDRCGPRKVKCYGVSYIRVGDNVVVIRPFVPKVMK